MPSGEPATAPETGAPFAVIKVVKGPGTGRVISLNQGASLSFGRADENDVVIEDLDVSRHHCIFACVQDLVTLTDLQSSNGTFINGKRITKAVLDGHTLIALGSFGTQLEFAYANAPAQPVQPQPVIEKEERLRLSQRRSKSRTPCRIAVWCNTEDQAFPGVVVDIGTGGLALQTDMELEQGTLVEVRPRENRYSAIRLAIRWRDGRSGSTRYGTCFAEDLESLRTSWVSDALRALGRDARTAQERRADIRVKTVWSLTLEGPDGLYKMQSVNLGSGGLSLEGPRTPTVGQGLLLEMGELTAAVRVVWARANRCGLSFLAPDEEQRRAIDTMVRKAVAGETSAPFALGAPPSSGETLDHYKLGPLLGEGGLGRVYRAYDTRLLRDVAIKVLVGESIEAEALERFLAEARAVARVSHPGVVTIFEIATGPRYYIAMELIHGEPLAKLLARSALSPMRATHLMRQVLEALQVVHHAGVIHRDLNTSNIMVCAHDKVKVLDFGLAKFADQVSSVTQAGQVWGTPQYMAPEQIDSRYGPIDPQTDLFAATSVFYEMLTGRPPFLAPTIPKLIYEILYSEPPDPRSLNPELSEEMAQILLRGLEKCKEDRFASAAEILRALS